MFHSGMPTTYNGETKSISRLCKQCIWFTFLLFHGFVMIELALYSPQHFYLTVLSIYLHNFFNAERWGPHEILSWKDRWLCYHLERMSLNYREKNIYQTSIKAGRFDTKKIQYVKRFKTAKDSALLKIKAITQYARITADKWHSPWRLILDWSNWP